MYKIKNININDYDKKYIELLEELTIVGNISKNDFIKQIEQINNNKYHSIFVIEYDNIIIGSITVLIEQKIIHQLQCVGHIEDLVVKKEYRGRGISNILLNYAIEYCKKNNCYKQILNCKKEFEKFYNKKDFISNNIEMSLYN